MRKRLVAAWVWTILIVVACWIPGAWLRRHESRPKGFLHIDKVIHGVMFAGVGFLWMRALRTPGRAARVAAFGLTLAVVTELGQATPIVDRDADPLDVLADSIGLLVGMGAAAGWQGTRLREPGAEADDPGSRTQDHQPSV